MIRKSRTPRDSSYHFNGHCYGGEGALVRKLAVPDLTTILLTFTITAFAAEFTLATGRNPGGRGALHRCWPCLVGRAWELSCCGAQSPYRLVCV